MAKYAEYVKRRLWYRRSDTDKTMRDLIDDHTVGIGEKLFGIRKDGQAPSACSYFIQL